MSASESTQRKFDDLPLGARFRYISEFSQVWVKIENGGEGIVAAWDGIDSSRVLQSICSAAESEHERELLIVEVTSGRGDEIADLPSGGGAGEKSPEDLGATLGKVAAGQDDDGADKLSFLELLRRYRCQRKWIHDYAHCLDGLCDSIVNHTGLLPRDLRGIVEVTQQAAAADAKAYDDAKLYGAGFVMLSPDGKSEHVPAEKIVIREESHLRSFGTRANRNPKPSICTHGRIVGNLCSSCPELVAKPSFFGER